MSASAEKTFEAKIADLIRRFGTEFEGEAIAVWRALKRLLASRDATYTDLGNGVEKLLTGGLLDAEMKRILEEGRAQGRAEARREQAESEEALCRRADGSYDLKAIALYLQREPGRLRDAERQFVNDAASRLTFPGRELSEKQTTWLLAIFRRLGGRLA